MTTQSPTQSPASDLRVLLKPIISRIAALKPQDCTDVTTAAQLAQTLTAEFPFDSAQVQGIATAVRRGIAEGWLCDRGEPLSRYCRLAKATPATEDLSVDIVALQGPALAHTHTRGEVTMAFPGTEDGVLGRFDGHAPGWVVAHAGSSHTPTVTGPTMHLLYFLPGGKVQWHMG